MSKIRTVKKVFVAVTLSILTSACATKGVLPGASNASKLPPWNDSQEPSSRDIASASSPSPVLLNYSAGFQAGWSWLKIHADGTVEHQERVCCPPVVNQIEERKLSTAEIATLKGLIESSTWGNLRRKSAVKLGLGQKVGSLFVFSSTDQKVVIQDVNRQTTGVGSTVLNDSPATAKIMNLVQSFVKNVILH